MLVQGSLAGDPNLILGPLKLHNPQLRQPGKFHKLRFSQEVSPWKPQGPLAQHLTSIQLWKHTQAGPPPQRTVT
jgi:hypothetical protein